jgi:hypothetical protein
VSAAPRGNLIGMASTSPGPTVFVLFGATGDRAKRMVLPAFYTMAVEGLLPADWLLVGNGRGDLAHEDFRGHVHDVLTEFGPKEGGHPAAGESATAGALRAGLVGTGEGAQAHRPGPVVARTVGGDLVPAPGRGYDDR